MKRSPNDCKERKSKEEFESSENKFIDELALAIAAIARQLYAAEKTQIKNQD